MQPLPHPLFNDTQVIRSTVFTALLQRDPRATLASLILQTHPDSYKVWLEYLTRGSDSPEADKIMHLSLLAVAELHRRGAIWGERTGTTFSQENQALWDIAFIPYNRADELAGAYGIVGPLRTAFEAYSNANKDVKILPRDDRMGLPERPNPHYMGQAPHWGHYGDGWTALTAAMRKMPTIGQLGLELTTYRAPRTIKPREGIPELRKLSYLAVETNIRHGFQLLDMGQQHYLSTAITYNQHWDRAAEVGGLIAITGTSGCYMNPFGAQGLVDGAEILYPPNLITVYEGANPQGYRTGDGQFLPVVHLREVGARERGQGFVDDYKYVVIAAKDNDLDDSKLRIIMELETKRDAAKVRAALARLGYAERGLMYLTIEELNKVRSAAG